MVAPPLLVRRLQRRAEVLVKMVLQAVAFILVAAVATAALVVVLVLALTQVV